MYKRFISQLLFIFVLLFFQLAAVNAFAYEKGTIVTKDGQRYENVTYDILEAYKIIKFKLGEADKNISFANVEAIYDADGTDVTASVLGGYYKPQKETWKSDSDPVVREGRRAKFTVGWRLGANYSIPVSDYYEGIEPGIGFDGDMLIGISRNFSMRLQISKSGMKVEDDFHMLYTDYDYTILKEDYDITTIRYMLCFQYNSVQGEIDRGKTMFYSYSGLGAVSQKVKPDVLVRDNYTDILYYANEPVTETKFAMNVGFGATAFLSKTAGIDFSINIDEVFVGSYAYGQSGLAFIIDLKVGLVVLLH
ncbi:MAG: hypothetical protein AB1746_02955 [Candidatus Zixiibacteriota bacterium]